MSLVALLAACAGGRAPTVVTEDPPATSSPLASPSPSLTPSPSPTPSPAPSPSPSPPVSLAFATDRAMEHARVLSADIGVRLAGTPEEERSEAYIAEAFRSAGCTVTTQPFTRADGDRSQNVIARTQANYEAGFVIIGGHYDTVPGSPGGNDNASGTGVVIALAETFCGMSVPVEFVAFAAEEVDKETGQHHEGSEHYARSSPDIKKVHAMASVDMIGNGARHELVFDQRNRGKLVDELAQVATDHGIPHRVRGMGDVSDHTSFSKRGVWSCLIYSGLHPTYHTPDDTFDVVQRDAVDRAGRLMLEWIKRRQGL